MQLKLTGHARERMRQRGIRGEDLEHALSHPVGLPAPGEFGSVWVYGIAAGGRILKVCRATDDANRIITAVWRD